MNINRRNRRAQQVRANYLRAKRDWLLEQQKADEKKAALEKAEKAREAVVKAEAPESVENAEKINEAVNSEAPEVRRESASVAPDEPKQLFLCIICGKTFKTKSGLSSHMRTKHKDEQ